MKTTYHYFILMGSILLILIFMFSCTTMPKVSEEDLALQGMEVNSIHEIINLIDTGDIKPQQIEKTVGMLDIPFYQFFNVFHTNRTSISGNTLKIGSKIIKFSDAKIGHENSGFLRKEDPRITFPIIDDSIETDSFTTAFDVWQFEGIEGQTIDLIVRSLSTFPTGMFVPYFLLLKDDGTIIRRQEHILPLGKESIKGQSIMVWIKDYILPKTGKYYLIILADNHKQGDWGTEGPAIRLNNDRTPLGTVYNNENWIIWDGKTVSIELDIEQIVNIYATFVFWPKGDLTLGKYHVILWET